MRRFASPSSANTSINSTSFVCPEHDFLDPTYTHHFEKCICLHSSAVVLTNSEHSCTCACFHRKDTLDLVRHRRKHGGDRKAVNIKDSRSKAASCACKIPRARNKRCKHRRLEIPSCSVRMKKQTARVMQASPAACMRDTNFRLHVSWNHFRSMHR